MSFAVAALLLATPAAGFASPSSAGHRDTHSAKAATKAGGDIDGDGRSDLVIGHQSSFEVQYTSAAPGGSSDQTITLPSPYDFVNAITVADFNGDGDGDVAVGVQQPDDSLPGAVVVYDGGPTGLAATPRIIVGPSGDNDFGDLVWSGKLNRDPDADLIVGSESGPSLSVYFGSSSGLSTTPRTLPFGDATAVAIGDLNHDGRPDIVVGEPGRGKVLTDDDNNVTASEGCAEIFYGVKHGLPVKHHQICGLKVKDGYGSFGSALAIAKVNSDKYADLVVGAPDGGHAKGQKCGGVVTVLWGGKHGVSAKRYSDVDSSTKALKHLKCQSGFGRSLVAGDVNGDGYADLIVGSLDALGLQSQQPGAVTVVRGAKHGISNHRGQYFPGRADSFDGLGSSLTTYRPQGGKYTGVAAGATDCWGDNGDTTDPYSYGYVDEFTGSKHGLVLVHRFADVGTKASPTGLALGA